MKRRRERGSRFTEPYWMVMRDTPTVKLRACYRTVTKAGADLDPWNPWASPFRLSFRCRECGKTLLDHAAVNAPIRMGFASDGIIEREHLAIWQDHAAGIAGIGVRRIVDEVDVFAPI